LCVSTIEPRKNYQLALDAFDLLADRIPTLSLVIVGKKGWRCQQIVKRITEHPEFESRLIWRQTVGDNELTALYRGALVTLSTSWAEGYGLSIIESMSHGTPVIASAGGAQREAGGRYAEYPGDLTAATWAEAIDRHLDAGRPSEHNRQQRELLTTFTPPTWQRSAELFLSTFTEPDPH
jgi:glycosyltransferase involved in cell wall biosynthesis